MISSIAISAMTWSFEESRCRQLGRAIGDLDPPRLESWSVATEGMPALRLHLTDGSTRRVGVAPSRDGSAIWAVGDGTRWVRCWPRTWATGEVASAIAQHHLGLEIAGPLRWGQRQESPITRLADALDGHAVRVRAVWAENRLPFGDALRTKSVRTAFDWLVSPVSPDVGETLLIDGVGMSITVSLTEEWGWLVDVHAKGDTLRVVWSGDRLPSLPSGPEIRGLPYLESELTDEVALADALADLMADASLTASLSPWRTVLQDMTLEGLGIPDEPTHGPSSTPWTVHRHPDGVPFTLSDMRAVLADAFIAWSSHVAVLVPLGATRPACDMADHARALLLQHSLDGVSAVNRGARSFVGWHGVSLPEFPEGASLAAGDQL